MPEDAGPLVLIVEPAAVSVLPVVERALAEQELAFDVERLGARSEARRGAADAMRTGRRFLVAVGGDDLVHEIVNGLFEGDERSDPARPVLGVIPAAGENEFLRQFGIPLDPERACLHLRGENAYPIDVGRVRCDGAVRVFVNIASVGLGAELAARAEPGSGRARQFLAFWTAVVRAKRAVVHVEASRKAYDGKAYDVVVGNGTFGLGGFRVSPRSFPGDGVLEVLVHHGPKSHAFTSLPKAYRGEQVPSPHITELRGNRVRVETDPPLPVAVDGRRVGRTPVEFDVLPQALLLKV